MHQRRSNPEFSLIGVYENVMNLLEQNVTKIGRKESKPLSMRVLS